MDKGAGDVASHARLPWGLACLCLLCACSDGVGVVAASQGIPPSGEASRVVQGKGGMDQDRFPVPPRAAVAETVEPFATAARERVAIIETMTRHGEPLQIGSIEVPKGWSIVAMDGLERNACEEMPQCLLWQAVSPDGAARMMLLSPVRADAKPDRGEGRAQSRIALAWLHPPEEAGQGDAAVVASGAVPAMSSATRKGWTAGGAWLSLAYEAFDTPMRELRALDVESRPDRNGYHRVQGWPMLVLRMPAGQYAADAAEAVRSSLQIDPQWVAQWWLAWELRTIRAHCKRGYGRGMCHVEEGYADYFRAGDSMGLWDIRSESPYGLPEDQHYDAAARAR